MSSYAALLIYEYDPSLPNGLGTCLVGSLGSSIEGTQTISNKYESVGFVKNGMNRNTKYGLFELLKKMSAKNPNRIISVKDLDDVPVIVQTILKNSKIYGIEFSLGKNAYGAPLLLTLANSYKPKNLFTVEDMATGTSRTYNFNNTQLSPNEMKPIDRETGTIAIVATPNSSSGKQTLLNIYADSNNNSVSIFYENGQFTYRLTKDGIPFAEMSVAPPTGSSFVGHTVSITLESLHQDKRKYGANIAEQVDIFRVSCPDLSFEQVVPQPIIWNWRHNEPDITASDRANARSFAFLSFTAFCPSMTTMTVGASNSSGQNIFTWLIQKLQISSNLPSGNSDFWN